MKRFSLRTIHEQKWLTRSLLMVLAVVMLLPVAVTFLFSFFSPAEIQVFMATRGSTDAAKWMEVKLVPVMFSMESIIRC